MGMRLLRIGMENTPARAQRILSRAQKMCPTSSGLCPCKCSSFTVSYSCRLFCTVKPPNDNLENEIFACIAPPYAHFVNKLY